MSISMYQASVPVFIRGLENLSRILAKGEEHAKSKGVDADRLLDQRLIFDMLPLVKQVQIACDTAARGSARMAAIEPQPFPDNETTLPELQNRIARTIEYLKTFSAAQIDGCEERDVVHRTRHGDVHYRGLAYLTEYALPNFFFHVSCAYAILRVAGTPIGKLDYLGPR